MIFAWKVLLILQGISHRISIIINYLVCFQLRFIDFILLKGLMEELMKKIGIYIIKPTCSNMKACNT
jgi:hypothetical protein